MTSGAFFMPSYLQVIKTFNQQLDDLSTEMADELSRHWLDAGESLLADLQKLTERIAESGEKPSRSQLMQMKRYQLLIAEVLSIIEQLQSDIVEPMTDDLQRKAVKIGEAYAASSINAVQGRFSEPVVKASFARLNVSSVNQIIALSRANTPLSKIFNSIAPGTASQMTSILVNGIARGGNPRNTARQMVKDGFMGGLNRAMVIARDQQLRAYRDSSRQSYRDFGVKQYRRVAGHDRRVCPACIAMDGLQTESDRLIPLHPQDRCAIIPVIPGHTINRKWGKQWFDDQPASVQREILGDGRYEAYKDNRFDFDKMVTVKNNPTWGPSAQVTSLNNLLKGRGGLGNWTPPTDPGAK